MTWPMVSLVLGIVGMFLFRKPLSQLIGRTKEVGKGFWIAGSQAQAVGESDQSDSVQEFMRSYDNQLLLDQEELIRSDIAARELTNSPELVRLLIRSLAGTQILGHFELAYAGIWDSQLRLLRQLNALEAGMSGEEITAYYDTVTKEIPTLEAYPLDSYVEFLESYNLIVRDEGAIEISAAGREFLKWLVETGRPDRGFL